MQVANSQRANLATTPTVPAAPQQGGVAVEYAARGGAEISKTAGIEQKDAGAATDPKFGDVLKQMQAKYGAKAEKPREIKKTLGKDDFMKIMITQMRHQDPTKPFDAENMATQMAQFTTMEQMQNMNKSLDKLANQQNPMERMAITGLIGKTVTVDRERFPHTENQADALNFVLSRDAKEAKIVVMAESGEVVLEKTLGQLKAGENTFSWDGARGNGVQTKPGNYTYRIEAKDDRSASIQTDSHATARVVGVTFERGEAVLLVGDLKNPTKVTMRNVVRVEETPGQTVPGASSLAAASMQAAGAAAPMENNALSPKNMFTFEKGKGSMPIDPEKISPDAANAMRMAVAQMQSQSPPAQQPALQVANVAQQSAPAPAQAPAQAPVEEKGFPHGLNQ